MADGTSPPPAGPRVVTPSRVVTLGCRLNIAESEAIAAELQARAGAEPVVVINGCIVTVEAARQTRQAARKARRESPDARVVVTGCPAQAEPEAYAAMPEVDHVVGNAGKLEAGLWASLGPASPRVIRPDWSIAARPAPQPRQKFQQRVRGFVEVQTGCDHACTFCIIPQGRGPSRSLPAAEVVFRVRALVEAGHAEVVLTGVDITDYQDGEARLGTLVRAILRAVPELPRLRLSSIDSVEADADLLRALAEEERLMPQLHLSLQAGDDLILKRMRRRHSRADAIAFCDEVRRLRPGIALGADLIAGFPTETEAMADRSRELIERCGLSTVHVFPYSARPGTPAARMPQLAPETVRARAASLREAAGMARAAWLAGEVGRTRRALVEHGGLARTEEFAAVRLDRDVAPGTLLEVALTAIEDGALTGTAGAVLRTAA